MRGEKVRHETWRPEVMTDQVVSGGDGERGFGPDDDDSDDDSDSEELQQNVGNVGIRI